MIGWIALAAGIVFIIISIVLFKKASNITIQKKYQQDQAQITDRAIEIKKTKLAEKEKVLDQIQQDIIELNQKRTDTLLQYDKQFQNLENLKVILKEKNLENRQLDNLIKDRQIEFEEIYEKQKKLTEQKIKDFKEVTNKAANTYIDNLEKNYQSAETRYKARIAQVQSEYEAAAAALEEIKKTRQAAQEAILHQQEIKKQKEHYCLIPTKLELNDIHSLEYLRETFSKPRVISMLIWTYYFQPIAKKQFPIILKNNTKTGIYKITNQQTDTCYIGQAIDIYKRWTQHCKAGLGIDTPVNNKLYKAMQEYGLENFSFELLCQCSNSQLNEKERYFISLYQSDLYGYNGTKGNK